MLFKLWRIMLYCRVSFDCNCLHLWYLLIKIIIKKALLKKMLPQYPKALSYPKVNESFFFPICTWNPNNNENSKLNFIHEVLLKALYIANIIIIIIYNNNMYKSKNFKQRNWLKNQVNAAFWKRFDTKCKWVSSRKAS